MVRPTLENENLKVANVLFLFYSLLLSFVSGEDTQDRTDRIKLTPWVKFLWEAYRNVLELLRNNIRVEKLYHDTAQQGKIVLTSRLIIVYFLFIRLLIESISLCYGIVSIVLFHILFYLMSSLYFLIIFIP